MRAYIFTLVLAGVSVINRKVEDALYEAGCDDALLALLGGVPTLEFTREADSLHHAVLSAVRDI